MRAHVISGDNLHSESAGAAATDKVPSMRKHVTVRGVTEVCGSIKKLVSGSGVVFYHCTYLDKSLLPSNTYCGHGAIAKPIWQCGKLHHLVGRSHLCAGESGDASKGVDAVGVQLGTDQKSLSQ